MEHRSSSANQHHEAGSGLTNGDGFGNCDEEMLLSDDLNGFGGTGSAVTAPGRSTNAPAVNKDSVR